MAVTLLVSAAVAVGSSLVAAALTPKPPTIGTLEDLAVQKSELGLSLPKIYGRYRVSGNVVWATPLRERVTAGSSSLFGLVQGADTVRYRTSCLAVLSQRCYKLGRVWLGQAYMGNLEDSTLFDPMGGDDGNHARLDNTRYFFDCVGAYGNLNSSRHYHPIQEFEGLGQNYPAFVNSSTIQFDALEVTLRFGGSIPAIEVEVIGQETLPTLEFVVRDVLEISGLDPRLIDVSVLSDTIVSGARLGYNGGSVKDFLEDLARVYLFNIYEDNETGMITAGYANRIQSPIIIPNSALFVKEYGSSSVEGIVETKSQPTELPTSVEITYPNELNAYKTGTQRIQSTRSRYLNEVRINSEVVLDDDRAATIIQSIFDTYRRQTETYSNILTDLTYANIGIDDAITFPLEGRQITAKVTRKAIGTNGIVEFEAISLDSSVDSNNNVAGTNGDYTPNFNDIDVQLRPIILQLPQLNEGDDGVGFYYSGFDDPNGDLFGSAQLMLDTDQTGLVAASTISALGAVGKLVTQIPFGSPDYTTNIDVEIELEQGQLDPNTERGFFNNEYVLLVNDELIGYLDAQIQPNGNYVVSTLSRGLHGTNLNTQFHLVNSPVYLVAASDYASWNFLAYNRDLIGAQMTSYLVPDGSTTADVVFTSTDTLNNASSKAFSPCNLNVTLRQSGILSITCQRRSSWGGYMRDGTGSIEPSGNIAPRFFEIEILLGNTSIKKVGGTSLDSGTSFVSTTLTPTEAASVGAGIGFAFTYKVSESTFNDPASVLTVTQSFNKLEV